MTKSVNKESIHLIFWDHVRRFWICWAMNASCKAHKPSCKSNYEQDMKKSSTMIFCNLRALEKIRRTRDLRKSDAIRKILNTENSELVCNELHEDVIRKNFYSEQLQVDFEHITKAESRRNVWWCAPTGFCAPSRRGLDQQEGQTMIKVNTTDINFEPRVFVSKEIHWQSSRFLHSILLT